MGICVYMCGDDHVNTFASSHVLDLCEPHSIASIGV